MTKVLWVPIAILLVGLGGTAWGMDLQLSIAGQAEYDPNVGRDKEDISSAVFRIVPKVHLIEDEGNLHYDVSYRPYYQYSTSSDGVDGFQHYLSASTKYFLGKRTELTLTDDFSYADSVDTINDISAEGVPTIATRDQPVSRNRMNFGIRHLLTPRLVGSLAGGWKLFNANIEDRADSNSFSGNLSLRYLWSERHSFGGGVSADYQKFQEASGGLRPPQETLFVSFYGGWTWSIDENTSFEFSVGPTFVSSEQAIVTTATVPIFPLNGSDSAGGFGFDAEDCPPAPGGGGEFGQGCGAITLDAAQFAAANAAGDTTVAINDPFGSPSNTSWTAFGSATLNRRWRPDLVSSITYRRSASTSSGLGSSVLDDLNLINTWEITELWDAAFRIDFTNRTSTSPTQQYVPIVTNQVVGAPGTACGPASGTCLASYFGNPFTTVRISQDIDTIRWGASARVTRQIAKHFQVSLRYTYASQTSKQNTLGLSSDFQDHLVTLGVQYNFDRWSLW
ncbi:MAG: hypothetical protein VX546_13355 [Myxococcota bacterium]|nr:hypothetical protein [Myxococcota bacterium]